MSYPQPHPLLPPEPWFRTKVFFRRNFPHRTRSKTQWCLPAGLVFFIGGTWDTGNGYAWHPPLWRMVERYYAERWHQAGYTLWSWIFRTSSPKRRVAKHGLWGSNPAKS